jgi:hypothetical protein
MASAELIWLDGSDVHVLAGETGPSLLNLLLILDDARNITFADAPPADVASITFTPNFVFAGAPPQNGGVTVDPATGKVTVTATPTLKSCVIEAIVKTKPPNAKTLDPIPIRVLVHKRIEDIWLTPPTLTIHDGSPGQRLTVLARFDDNTVGDVGRRAGITWDSSAPATIGVDAVDGRLTAHTHAAGGGRPPGVTITARHAGHDATARVEAAAPWATPTAVTLVPGSPGVTKAAQVPNILFLSEGFGPTAAERRRFESLARAIVCRLHSVGSLRPYDLTRDAVNFWSVFVPGRERGASPLYDLNPTLWDGKLLGFETPAPVKPAAPPPPPPVGPPAPGDAYTVENLVYQVGLPAPADATVPLATAKANWVPRYGQDLDIRVSADVYAQWQALFDHRLANEVDNAFGIANGDRPAMHQAEPAKAAYFNPRRTSRADLDAFLASLRVGTATGPAIGPIWATKTPAAPPDPSGAGLPAGLKTGQDSTLVYVLLGGSPFSGQQRPELIASSLVHEQGARIVEDILSRQVDLEPYAVPVDAPLSAASRVAHELGHAFGLGDEYGEFKDPVRIPSAKEKDLKDNGNLQPGSVLERSAADRRLDPAKLDKIKWLWPRIEHAGVLAAKPAPSGANFEITLVRGHGAGFAKDNLVRLRLRPLVDHPAASKRLKVIEVKGDVVTVTPLTGTINRDDWPAGSVLIRPVRGSATAADPQGPDLTLVAPIIAAHLAASGYPLNQKPPPPAVACVVDEHDVQTPLNLPAGLPYRRPRYPSSIVGLWDGGSRYFCGVYHPSGSCLMRMQEPLATLPTTYLFCPVCRYILVDRLDPRQHAAIDRDYARRWPQP